jgi:hypothetical protein
MDIGLEGLEIINQGAQRRWIDADGRLCLNPPIVDVGVWNTAGLFIRQ